MVYVPKRKSTRGLNDSALTASLTAAKTSHCGGNTCAGEQYVVSSITAGLRDASAASVGSVFIPG